MLQFPNGSFTRVHPWGIGFNGLEVAISLAAFACKMALCLFKGTIADHVRGNTFLLGQDGQCFVGMAFEPHGVYVAPAKVSGKDLGIFVATARGCASNQRVTKHFMSNPAVSQHVIICWVFWAYGVIVRVPC